MKRIFKLTTIIGLMVALISGCAINRATGSVEPGTNLSSLKTIYVKKFERDNRGVDELIADKLRTKGVTVTSGTENNPKNVDAVVTYVDKWMWDITMYMLELDIVIRETESGFPMAKGNSFHTSLTRLSPKEMVNEVIENIYSKGNK